MPQSYRGRALSNMRNNERAMQALFRQLAASIASEVTRRAEGDGTVPRSATFEIQQAAGDKITSFFLGYNRQGKRAPFDVLPGGAVFPVSPFMRQLWSAISAAVRIPVEQNAAILNRRLPADVLLVMRQAKVDPLAAGRAAVAEQIFRPNPLAQYDAPHQWVDPNGYRLSDRVWNTAASTRQHIDRYLDVAIREGRGALRMSRELEQFLIPGQQLRTKAPYGTDASFDAMRLARTEITRAHLEASRTSAAMNPFVQGMKWNLSARHPKIDICDSYARGGPNGDGVYPIDSYPGIPHPNCLCFSTNALVGDPDEILDELRRDIRRERALLVDKVGPVEVDRFTALLLGETPAGVVQPPVVQPPPVIAPPIVAPTPPRTGGQEVPSAADLEAARLRAEQRRREEEERQRQAAEERRLQEEREAAAREALRLQLEREARDEAARREQQRIENEARLRATPAPLVATNGAAAEARSRILALDAEYRPIIAAAENAVNQLRERDNALFRQIEALELSAAKRAGAKAEQALVELAQKRAERSLLNQQIIASRQEQKRLQAESNEKVMAALAVPNPARVTMNAEGEAPGVLSGWRTGFDAFNRLVSADVVPPGVVPVNGHDGDRTNHYNPNDRTLNLNRRAPREVVAHEVMHWLEANNPDILQKEIDFFERRTAGETTGPIFGDYRGMVGRRDKFMSIYMGREYINPQTGRRYATEIGSVGIEYMIDRPAELARQDPDMFDFIYNLLRGR